MSSLQPCKEKLCYHLQQSTQFRKYPSSPSIVDTNPIASLVYNLFEKQKDTHGKATVPAQLTYTPNPLEDLLTIQNSLLKDSPTSPLSSSLQVGGLCFLPIGCISMWIFGVMLIGQSIAPDGDFNTILLMFGISTGCTLLSASMLAVGQKLDNAHQARNQKLKEKLIQLQTSYESPSTNPKLKDKISELLADIFQKRIDSDYASARNHCCPHSTKFTFWYNEESPIAITPEQEAHIDDLLKEASAPASGAQPSARPPLEIE